MDHPHTLETRGLSAQAVADELGVAECTVRRWIESGKLPAERRGRSFVIKLEDARRLHFQAPIGRTDRTRIGLDRELDELKDALQRREGELMELRGRYHEVVEQLRRLEQHLHEERRTAARLEILLEDRAA